MRRRKSAAALVVAVLGMSLAGCGSDGDAGSSAPVGTGAVAVVASTDVWGDVAKQVGGDDVEVTSIISDPDQDPHSYEASTSTALAISKADLVIENGGGYDDFMDRLLGADNPRVDVINAVDVSGKTPVAGEELNEHVWYDLPTVAEMADQIAGDLSRIAPGDASTFTNNAEAFKRKVNDLSADEAAWKKKVAGKAVGITEPVPLYMTSAMGLVNKTPAEFSEAVEEGNDVSPAVLNETLDLYSEHEVSALVYNEQTSGPITEEVKSAADRAHVPVVPVTETLPDGLDYLTWMRENITDIGKAVS